MILTGLLAAAMTAYPAAASEAPQGTVVVYIDNRRDRKHVGDFAIDAALAYLKGRYTARLSQVLPSSRYRVFTGEDHASGEMQRFFEALAAEPGGGPVDLITMSHSGGNGVETPVGAYGSQEFATFFQMIPGALDSRLRLFYNGGCYGENAHVTALNRGFVVSLGTEDKSIGPVMVDEFLLHYMAGDTAVEAARRINENIARGGNWTAAYAVYKAAEGLDKGREDYAKAGLKVYTHSPRAEAERLATAAEALPGMRSRIDPKTATLWGNPDTLLKHEADLLPEPLKGVHARSVVKHGDKFLKSLSSRLAIDFDGSSAYLPDSVELDLRRPDITKIRVAPLGGLDNSVLAYERNLDLGIQHDAQLIRVSVPLAAYSAGGDTVLARAAVAADISAGYRHRPGRNTGYAELHARADAKVDIAQTVGVGGRAEIWLSGENSGARCAAELFGGAQVRLDQKGARLEAGYSRFYSDLLNRVRGAKDDWDAFLVGVTLGR